MARHFEADEDEWGLVGLLHDADYEVTEKDPDRHMHVIVERVRAEGVSERIVQGILAHGGQAPLDNELNASIFACDHLSGLITAYALLHPQGLAGVKTKGVLKRFRQTAFARGVDRDDILTLRAKSRPAAGGVRDHRGRGDEGYPRRPRAVTGSVGITGPM